MVIDLAPARKRSASKAQAFGALFESMFETFCKKSQVAVTRFPNGCKRLSPTKLLPMKTPCDWIISYDSKTALIDTKTCETSFPHSHILPHQVNEMEHHEIAGAFAGYVIWYRTKDQIFFVPASTLNTLRQTRGSIDPNFRGGIYIGSGSYADPRLLFRKREKL